MIDRLKSLVLPEGQRRSLDDLREELDLSAGDRSAKRSGFWTMLVLSALVAAAGILSESTVTVIGAMIIAPLATPIINVALGIVLRDVRRALIRTALGTVLVIAIGYVASLAVVAPFDPADNSEIAARVFPDTYALVTAIATGLAGAIARARKDLSGVLPGVAVAISLVPPLVVVGICLGSGAFQLALGALLLYLSNLVALVLTGAMLFAVLGYGAAAPGSTPGRASTSRSTRRSWLVLTIASVAILVPIIGNTIVIRHVHTWQGEVAEAAEQWLSGVPDARVTDVSVSLGVVEISITAPGSLPPTSELLSMVESRLPDGYRVSIEQTTGRSVDVGTVGGPGGTP